MTVTPEFQAICVALVREEMRKMGVTRGPLWDGAAEHPDLAVETYGSFARAALNAIRDRPRGEFDNYLYFTNDAWAEEIDHIIGPSPTPPTPGADRP